MNNNHPKVYGLHSVMALLKNRPQDIEELWIDENRKDRRMKELMALVQSQAIRYQIASKLELNELVGHDHHQGVVSQVSKASNVLYEDQLIDFIEHLTEPAFLLLLDCIQDPHNLGACLRSADAAGVHAVIMTKDKSSGITPVVQKVASGAAEHLPIFQVTNLARVMQQLKKMNIWLLGTDERGKQNLFESDLTGPLGIVMGGEGLGLRDLTKKNCDYLIHIPMKAGSVPSLNVSVATGICLFETVRQRSS